MLPSGSLFYKTYENFINICENCSSDFGRHRDKLNQILNELNSVDHKLIQLLDVKRLAERLVSVLINIPITEDTILVKTYCLTNELFNKHSIPIPTKTFDKTINFLTAFIKQHKYVGVCDAVQLIQTLVKNQDRNESETITESSEAIQQTIELLLDLMKTEGIEKSSSCRYDGYSVAETKISVLFCLETILASWDKLPVLSSSTEMTIDITNVLFDLIYSIDASDQKYCVIMKSALHSCHYIGMSNKAWCTEHVGDILGACIVNMLFGLPGIPVLPPQRIQSAQQAIQNLNSTPSVVPKKGGKMVKGRKPRQTAQYKNRKNIKTNDDANNSSYTEDTSQSFGQSMLLDYAEEKFTISTFTTSDSDASDNETNRLTKNREKETKLRYSALSLICVLAKNVERKIFFGYWHCLFPSEELTQNTIALLNCVLRDSNQRCRITALQAASLILYGSKSYLSQAEITNKPSSFTPFSVALGNRIVVLYSTLTHALAGESSLPVLTQILKCLAVLVQSTSFQKLQNAPGLIKGFVVYIRRLVHHKDPTVKVAALIVMEFLLSGNEITNEISDCVGLFKLSGEENRRIHDFGEDEVVELEESSPDSEYEEDDIPSVQNEASDPISPNSNMSWLLQIALENLGVTVRNYITPKQSSTSMQVRHQCLQIILTMAPHYIWIKPHLILISQALENAFLDDIPSVCQRAARCLDVITHSINAYLLSQSAINANDFEQDTENALIFWIKMLQSITAQLQDINQNVITKSIFCDVLSNIGVNIYERLSRDKQIQIISLLSGLSLGDDESIVRASAVRALAIFVLFPSLRDDICFIENTSEAILKIILDENLTVRIKGSWALANITDALVTNIADANTERVSDDLLLRLFEITDPLCSSNDKVRTNAARILGNLLRLVRNDHIKSQKWQTKCYDAIRRLIDQAKLQGGSLNMKVKWNACYAIGNFMKNPVIFEMEQKGFDWQESIYKTLCDIIVNCTNFKVRINGATALAVPKTRLHYGKNYNEVWNSLLVGLYQANCLTDYNEYNHRDNLLDQLCITISHLIMLLTPDDLPEIENIVLQHHDSTKNNWLRVINRMVPEKSATLLMAHLHLENFSAWNTITPDQATSLQTLLSCFVSITEYD